MTPDQRRMQYEERILCEALAEVPPLVRRLRKPSPRSLKLYTLDQKREAIRQALGSGELDIDECYALQSVLVDLERAARND